ncbi:MAG: ubiquitin-like domain-containing protein [Brevefilum sp.]
MIDLIKQKKNWRFLAAVLVIILGAVLIRVGVSREITVVVDGEPHQVRTAALTVSSVLRAAEISFGEEDRVVPDPGSFMWDQDVIHVDHAQTVIIRTPEEEFTLVTTERVPSNLMGMAGIDLYPEDRLRMNGEMIDPQAPLDLSGNVLLQYDPAVTLTVVIDDAESTLYTHQPTLGAALEDGGIYLNPNDWVSDPLTSSVTSEMTVSIRRAKPITVSVNGSTINGLSSGRTVGDALQDAGISLQNLDYSLPPDDAPIPQSREIEVVRVREDVMVMTDEVAYENEYVEDPNTLLDQISVIEPGQVGIYATRERVRYEDGEAVDRLAQDSWQASEAEDGILGYGSNVKLRTEVVDGREIEYWRKISVYATSYSPCRCGTPDGSCCFGSASGLPSEKGLIAVTPNWYNMMKFQKVYVQGYGEGVIGNVGGGAHYFDHYWIDLAYSDDDYVSWHNWTTMYFLPPIPAWIPNPLPWP